MTVGGLAQIGGRHVEAENFRRANQHGQTALDLAKARDRMQIVALIEQKIK